MLRAQWGKTGSGYHVLPGQPTILPNQYVSVPANLGCITTYRGLPYRLVDWQWWGTIVQQMLSSLPIDTHTLACYPTGVEDGVFLDQKCNALPHSSSSNQDSV